MRGGLEVVTKNGCTTANEQAKHGRLKKNNNNKRIKDQSSNKTTVRTPACLNKIYIVFFFLIEKDM